MTDQTEANLPGTIAAFQAAIHALAGRTRDTITRDNGKLEPVWGDSIYQQLVDYVSGAQGTGHGSHARSMPPIVIDAVDLIKQIDSTVRGWATFDRPGRANHGDTIGLLYRLEDKPWRPQDVPQLTERTQDLVWWCGQARALLDPPRRWTLPSPCPECAVTTVYRKDSAGEVVRQPALQITDDGCVCQHCREYWPPERFGILAEAIKQPATAGDTTIPK
ncbi:DUF7341 domain-containing protein [Gordonia sp. (in: high G+C Gram-positive bacteria)]|uniref:DUF7341 domain-containing protein n=1 Tax=Gordonia sp. (in: high G+C Gram-positive bacteria) TaxID=84139 RepID=UPI003C719BCC